MKTILVSLFVSALSLTAFASNEHHPTPAPTHPTPIMLGEWKATQPIHSNGGRIHLRYSFTLNEMTTHARCQTGPGSAGSLTVGATTRASYNGNYIYTHDNVDAQVGDGYRFCSISLRPSTWEFYFQSADMNQAVIFSPIPQLGRISVVRVPSF